jgi:hypothetical protein
MEVKLFTFGVKADEIFFSDLGSYLAVQSYRGQVDSKGNLT